MRRSGPGSLAIRRRWRIWLCRSWRAPSTADPGPKSIIALSMIRGPKIKTCYRQCVYQCFNSQRVQSIKMKQLCVKSQSCFHWRSRRDQGSRRITTKALSKLDIFSYSSIYQIHTRCAKLGEPPSLVNPPNGCRFHPRCAHTIAGLCDEKFPPDFEPEPDHFVACWLYQPK